MLREDLVLSTKLYSSFHYEVKNDRLETLMDEHRKVSGKISRLLIEVFYLNKTSLFLTSDQPFLGWSNQRLTSSILWSNL